MSWLWTGLAMLSIILMALDNHCFRTALRRGYYTGTLRTCWLPGSGYYHLWRARPRVKGAP